MMLAICLNLDFRDLGIGFMGSGGLEVGFYSTKFVVLFICD
jgi:hypothetical protein